MNSDKHRPDGPLSAEDILRYHRGEMTPEQMNALEQAALDDPFLADALDGWENEVDASLLQETSADSSGGGSSWWRWPLLIGGVAVFAFAAYRIYDNLQELGEMHEQVLSDMQKSEMPYIISPRQDSLDDLEIDLSRELPLADQVVIEEYTDKALSISKKNEEVRPQTPEASAADAPKSIDRPDVPEVMTPKQQSLPTTEPSVEEALAAHPVYFEADLKVADYREMPSRGAGTITIWTHANSGTAADRSEKTTTSGGFKVEEVPYETYLAEAMRDFRAVRYKEALKRYRQILKSYPDDVNAHFYGGLAYYNLDRQSKALDYLMRAAVHPSRVFDQEAEWYRALSLIQADRTSEARVVLRAIAAKGLFYAPDAARRLRQLD